MATNTLGRQSYTYRDARGNTARTSVYISYDSAAPADAEAVGLAVFNALATTTNGAVVSTSGPLSRVYPVAWGSNAPYPNVEDKAQLTLIAADGSLHRLSIPAPVGSGAGSLFLLDGETISPAAIAGLLTALTTAVNAAYVSSRGRQAIIGFAGGMRERRRMHRRLSIFSKSAGLDEPGE